MVGVYRKERNMTARRLTFEDLFKPNYDKKLDRKPARRKQRQANKYRQEEDRKRNWERIRRASIEEFGN